MIKIAAFIDVREIEINYSELKQVLMDSFSDYDLSIDIEEFDILNDPENYDMSFDIQGSEYDDGGDEVFSSVTVAIENTSLSKEYEFGTGENIQINNGVFVRLLKEVLSMIRATNVIVKLA